MTYGVNLYGETGYTELANAPTTIDGVEVDLMKYLPLFYFGGSDVTDLQHALGVTVGKLQYDLNDLLMQFFVESASWNLDKWEKFLGLDTDISKSNEFRRERVKAKLRSNGTVTKARLKLMISAFAGGDAEIIEYPDEYRFVIKFTGVKGVPANMAGLSASIDEIKPAHLLYSYAYTYNVWQFAYDQAYTWASVSGYTWEALRTVS